MRRIATNTVDEENEEQDGEPATKPHYALDRKNEMNLPM